MPGRHPTVGVAGLSSRRRLRSRLRDIATRKARPAGRDGVLASELPSEPNGPPRPGRRPRPFPAGGNGPTLSLDRGIAPAEKRMPDHCPPCGVALLAFGWEGVELDRCPRCGGIWLDAGEMETIVRILAADSGDATPVRVQDVPSAPPSTRRCARCRRRMSAARAGAPPGVEVERCGSGHGL